jgi:hypothetical protein
MWERAARHNPLSFTNYYYLDHRPFLPQDPTFNHLWRKQHSDYQQIIITLGKGAGKRLLFLNNLPVADRERAKILLDEWDHLKSCLRPVNAMLAVFFAGVLSKFGFRYKSFYPLAFVGGYMSANFFTGSILNNHHHVNILYYFQKYEHLTVGDMKDIKDPRRSYFRVDTSEYYRQTADEIQGHHGDHGDAHHGAEHEEHHDHDTSTYYGPFPVIF